MKGSKGEFDAGDLVQRYLAGESMTSLCEFFGTHRRVGNRVLAEHGVQPRRRAEASSLANTKRVDETAMTGRYLAGESVTSLSRGFGVDQYVVRRILREHQIPLRGQAEAFALAVPDIDELLSHHGTMLLVDAFSSSEALGMGVSVSGGGAAAKTASFTLGPDVKVLTEDGRPIAPGSEEVGVLALAGRNPLGYYKDEEKSERTFKEIDGVRYSIPGDYAQVDADGTIHLLGRGSVCINSGGEKIFPEEVEEALKTHDAVHDAVVVGIPHPTYGEQIVAVVEPVEGAPVPSEAELIEHVKDRLASLQGAPARAVRGHDRAGAQRQGRLQAPPGRVGRGARGVAAPD